MPCKPVSSFNPRPHTAGDGRRDNLLPACRLFQSTPAHGGRLHLNGLFTSFWCFNPRPHTAGDQEYVLWCLILRSFNPRPHTAGDKNFCWSLIHWSRFQSTPAHGGRLLRFCKKFFSVGCFNPRPHTAGDRVRDAQEYRWIWFQSTPAHGGRLSGVQSPLHSAGCFNPRPHTAGDCPDTCPDTE